MIHRAYALKKSSTTKAFNAECAKLRSIFNCLDYPMGLIDSAINNSVFRNASANTGERNTDDSSAVRTRAGSHYSAKQNLVRTKISKNVKPRTEVTKIGNNFYGCIRTFQILV